MSNTIKRSNPLVWLLDPLRSTADRADDSYRFKWSNAAWLLPAGIGVAGLLISAVGWIINPEQFYFSYLVGWTFCISLALGGLFFVLIQHLAGASWSVVVRRISEALLWSFPMLAILGIPVLFGMHDLYHWTHLELFDPASEMYDSVIAGKQAYLNTPFFIGRLGFYFLAWSYLAHRLYTLSIRQDVAPEVSIGKQLRRVSAWGLAVTAITTSFAAFDILMSLDPHWFSTIFGIYFFSGSFMAIMAFMVLMAMTFQKAGMLEGTITPEHYQDLGKFLFGFIVFWAYIAFSQYMLIWYANLPEETVFFRHRMEHGWEFNSGILLWAHFIIPFIVLISRSAKRSKFVLAFMSVWMLIMHWFDFHWIAMPVLHEHSTFHYLDFTTWIGLFGLLVGAVMFRMSRHSLVPQRDPHLNESLHFINS